VIATTRPYIALVVDCLMDVTVREEFTRLLGGRLETEE
jgi:hypothetical protein